MSSEHPGELLSALVDGELGPDERRGVDEHLAGCDSCRHEVAALERARELLRSLPELDPPVDFIEAIVRRRHRLLVRGTLGAFAAAVVVAVVALSSDVLPEPRVEPELAALATEHATTAVTAPDTRSASATFDDVAVVNEVAGFELVAVRSADDVVHAMYRRDGDVVSLFRQAGAVDWGSLPDEGSRLTVGERDVWQAADASSTVVDADGAVLTLVGGDPAVRIELASEVVEAPSPGWWDRAHDAAQTVLGAFDFG